MCVTTVWGIVDSMFTITVQYGYAKRDFVPFATGGNPTWSPSRFMGEYRAGRATTARGRERVVQAAVRAYTDDPSVRVVRVQPWGAYTMVVWRLVSDPDVTHYALVGEGKV